MSPKTLHAQFGLKWNPFTADAPLENFILDSPFEHFAWRVEQLTQQGGFALITGESGTGKSTALRLLVHRLSELPELQVRLLSRPQGFVGDCYRELGDLFGIALVPHNRWAGTKLLRQRWLAHIESTRLRPVLVVDEAQESSTAVLNELRLLASVDLDSRLLLTVVLAGDPRLNDRLRSPELLPLGTRLRARLHLPSAAPEQLALLLDHSLAAAGNSQLMTEELRQALCTHAAGNRRVLMNLCADLLCLAVERKLQKLDEQLFFEIAPPATRSQAKRR